MKPELTDRMWWVVVDGPCGTEYVPEDVCGRLPLENASLEECWAHVEPYCENRSAWTISERQGYGARLIMPGYLDRTDWIVADTATVAKRELEELYDLCGDCGLDWDECKCDGREEGNST